MFPFFGVVAGVSMALFFWLVTKWNWGTHLIVPVVGILLGVLFALSSIRDYLFIPLRTYASLPTVWDRWKARIFRDRGKPGWDAVDAIVQSDRSGHVAGWYLLLVGVMFAVILAQTAGSLNAKTTFTYALRQKPTPCIVVRRYGDNLICMGIDTTHNRVLDSFSLLSVGDSVTLAIKTFGRLEYPDDRKTGHLFGGAP